MQRVEFQLTKHSLRSGRIMKAAREVFGERINRWAYYDGTLTVECTLEQFGLFAIKRGDCGAQMTTFSWVALNPKLLPPLPLPAREIF